jgi:monovalent cation:H+ antiporter-2, CPA2 family
VSVLAASASGPPAYLEQVVALVGAAAVIGYLCARARVVPIVGFLLAGVLIGPSALGVVREREVVDAAAEVGVILLLFTIGIEFSIARLMAIRRTVLLGGSLQVGLAVVAVTGVCAAVGVDLRSSLFTGLVVSLSSTALVLKLLADRGATGSPSGQAAVGLLVFQDLAVVAMVLLVPVLGSGGGSVPDLGRALGTALAVVVVTLVVARRVMPRVLEAVARACSPEVFLLSVIALCLGTAYLTALAGVSVSLGAFLAGLVVSESRHSAHALGEVLPLQIIFSAVFFLSVGTLLDVRFLVEEPLLVLAAVALVVVVKVVTTTVAVRAVGLPLGTSAAVALLLAQVGEFAFVLERAGAAEGLSPAGLGDRGGQAFLAATVVLLVATPGLAALGRRVAARTRTRAADVASQGPAAPAEGHVLVSGWGRAARALTRELHASGERVVVTTLNPDGAAEAERLGLDVVRGDSTRAPVLHEAGAGRARVVVVADDEPEQAALIAGAVSVHAPQARVVVLAPDADDVPALHDAGADLVVLARRAAHDRLVGAVRDLLRDPAPPGRTVVDVSAVRAFRAEPSSACAHAGTARPVVASTPGCAECLRTGADWVHLRLCTACGHVGCCDSSPGRHAAAHAADAEHPVMCSLEPGEDWGWCYLDEVTLAPAPPGR